MLRVFNCGIGMVLVVPRGVAQDISERLNGMGERAYEIGVIERKARDEDPPLLYQALEERKGG
jgi:phosphoribosylformylglycinamidine cyclo-ligase